MAAEKDAASPFQIINGVQLDDIIAEFTVGAICYTFQLSVNQDHIINLSVF